MSCAYFSTQLLCFRSGIVLSWAFVLGHCSTRTRNHFHTPSLCLHTGQSVVLILIYDCCTFGMHAQSICNSPSFTSSFRPFLSDADAKGQTKPNMAMQTGLCEATLRKPRRLIRWKRRNRSTDDDTDVNRWLREGLWSCCTFGEAKSGSEKMDTNSQSQLRSPRATPFAKQRHSSAVRASAFSHPRRKRSQA
jgi:hypothetical protein